MALAVAIVEPVQVGAVPLAALALVAAVLMPALAHLPLEGASGRLVALHDLDGALMVALLGPRLPCSSASILARSRSSSSVVAFSICVLVSILASLMSCVLHVEYTAHRTNRGWLAACRLSRVPVLKRLLRKQLLVRANNR